MIAIKASSKIVIIIAKSFAKFISSIKKGKVCNMPPMNVATPVIIPLITGEPRPVNLPSSLIASACPMLIPAPTDTRVPAINAVFASPETAKPKQELMLK